MAQFSDIFSACRWICGLGSEVRTEPKPKVPDELETEIYDLLSCSEFSSQAISDELSPSSSLDTSWIDRQSPAPPSAAPRMPLPPCYVDCIGRIQDVLQIVLDVYPDGTPSSTICHALGYILHAQWDWKVKFCCKRVGPALPHGTPCQWVEDVLIVSPADKVQFVVDLQFRDKFVFRCPGAMGEQYPEEVLRCIPSVFVGTLGQLFRDLVTWTSVIEKAFQGTSATLPPWRKARTFQMLYKFCAEYDPTEAMTCLGMIAACLAEEEALIFDEANCCCAHTGQESAFLENLKEALQLSCNVGGGRKVLRNISLCSLAGLDYEFEKESPVASVETNQSGLSFLLSQ